MDAHHRQLAARYGELLQQASRRFLLLEKTGSSILILIRPNNLLLAAVSGIHYVVSRAADLVVHCCRSWFKERVCRLLN